MVHGDGAHGGLPHDEPDKRHCDWNPEAFAAFWKAYPKKTGKVHAVRIWDRLRLPESEMPALMEFLKAYAAICGYGGTEHGELELTPAYACAYEYYEAWGSFVFPADIFLIDRPWAQ